MKKLKILKAPHAILKQKARKVEEQEFGFELEELMNAMLDTMYESNGVGLAAPQIGDSRRILVSEPPSGDEPVSLCRVFSLPFLDIEGLPSSGRIQAESL